MSEVHFKVLYLDVEDKLLYDHMVIGQNQRHPEQSSCVFCDGNTNFSLGKILYTKGQEEQSVWHTFCSFSSTLHPSPFGSVFQEADHMVDSLTFWPPGEPTWERSLGLQYWFLLLSPHVNNPGQMHPWAKDQVPLSHPSLSDLWPWLPTESPSLALSGPEVATYAQHHLPWYHTICPLWSSQPNPHLGKCPFIKYSQIILMCMFNLFPAGTLSGTSRNFKEIKNKQAHNREFQ